MLSTSGKILNSKSFTSYCSCVGALKSASNNVDLVEWNNRFYKTSIPSREKTWGNITKSPNVGDIIEKIKKDPGFIKERFTNFLKEFRKYYDEKKEKSLFHKKWYQNISDPNEIDMWFKFEKDEDLNEFSVSTDSDHNLGYSSASLKITPNQTALFSGNLSTVVPPRAKTLYTGYVNMMCHRKKLSFFRPGYYDFTYYTHLVIKLRGDGRSWLMIFATPYEYQNTYTYQYSHPLYTRGGPYWQVTKIPLSHFFFVKETRIAQKGESTLPKDRIARFGLTLSDTYDGPFKLEIDYIGFERISSHKEVSPYETYIDPLYPYSYELN